MLKVRVALTRTGPLAQEQVLNQTDYSIVMSQILLLILQRRERDWVLQTPLFHHQRLQMLELGQSHQIHLERELERTQSLKK
jgi:hypothetical protein